MSYPMCWSRFPFQRGKGSSQVYQPLGVTFTPRSSVMRLPSPTTRIGEYGATLPGVGSVVASTLAAQVQGITGIHTTADMVVLRAEAAGIVDPGSFITTAEQKIEATLSGLARSIADGASGSAVVESLLPVLSEYTSSEVSRATKIIIDAGLAGKFAEAGYQLIGSMLSPIRDLIGDLGSIIGEGTLREIVDIVSRTLGKAVSQVSEMIPFLSAGFKLINIGVESINRALFIPSGRDVPATAFARDPLNLYLYLVSKSDPRLVAGYWDTADFNPFLQETVVHHSRMSVLSPVRALDLGSVNMVGSDRFPDWRTVFSGDVARQYVRGDLDDPYYVAGHDAFNVKGCDCGTMGSHSMGSGVVQPYVWPARWRQQRPEHRAAMVAASWLCANVGCVRGFGAWSSTPRAYEDYSPYYDIGYGPDPSLTTWWARWDGSDVLLLPPANHPLREMKFADAERRFGADWRTLMPELATGLRRALLPGNNDAERNAMRSWFASARWQTMPVAARSSYFPKQTPITPIAPARVESEGIGAIPIVAGAAGVGLLAWLLLAK